MNISNSRYLLSVAPMMDCTDRHCRYLLRLIAPRVRLYTEMVAARALLHGDRARLLAFDPSEHPVALQLGGSDPTELARAAVIGAAAGYDELNLNVGCPSDRVQHGGFGACLMAEPKLVAECIAAMGEAATIPVTVKTRIGIDDNDDYAFLVRFVEAVADAGCRTLIVHARKAILEGLSPRQNREVPPLDYERVYRLKSEYPELRIILNGGVRTTDAAEGHLKHVDGVMIGREAYHNPYWLGELQAKLIPGDNRARLSRYQIVERYMPYVETQLAQGERLQAMTRHMLGLFNGQPGARRWRRFLSEHARRDDAGIDVLSASMSLLAVAA